MPLADAIDRYAWQEEFAEVTNRLAQTFPDEYAGARIVGDGLSTWIGFRAEVPALAADLVDSLPKPVELVRGRGFTQDELIAALEQSYYKVYRWPDIANAAGTVDIETGVITIEAEPSTELGFVQREQLRAALTQAPGPNPAITLRLIVVDELPAYETEGHMRGGAYFSPSQSRSAPGRCTTGFSVRTSTNSARGVATAGHCAQSVVRRHYQNHGSSSWSSYGREAWHVGTHGDVGWYGRHANPLPQFFSSWNGIRLVTANRAASEGQRLWVFGTTSGQRSAIVDATGNCIAGMCNLVAMDRDVTAGGDSGGPWFTGNTAVGIHSGVYASRSHFTPTFTLSSRHGLVVLRA